MSSLPVRTLVVVRHGRTAWNAERRFQGRTDQPLTEAGRHEAEVAARGVAKLEPTDLLTSDAIRATQTARPLAERCGLTSATDPRLREADLGAAGRG